MSSRPPKNPRKRACTYCGKPRLSSNRVPLYKMSLAATVRVPERPQGQEQELAASSRKATIIPPSIDHDSKRNRKKSQTQNKAMLSQKHSIDRSILYDDPHPPNKRSKPELRWCTRARHIKRCHLRETSTKPSQRARPQDAHRPPPPAGWDQGSRCRLRSYKKRHSHPAPVHAPYCMFKANRWIPHARHTSRWRAVDCPFVHSGRPPPRCRKDENPRATQLERSVERSAYRSEPEKEAREAGTVYGKILPGVPRCCRSLLRRRKKTYTPFASFLEDLHTQPTAEHRSTAGGAGNKTRRVLVLKQPTWAGVRLRFSTCSTNGWRER